MAMPNLQVGLRPARRNRTRLLISATLPRTTCASVVRQLCTLLARWLGRPVCVALPVDGPSDDWFDYWTDALAALPAAEVEFRFVLRPHVPKGADSGVDQ